MTPPTATAVDWIVATPGTCGGEPRVAGTRIKVRHIATWVDRQGLTAEQIIADYPQLSRPAIVAALAYARANPAELQQAAEAEARLVAAWQAASGPSVARKFAGGQKDGPDGSLSPR